MTIFVYLSEHLSILSCKLRSVLNFLERSEICVNWRKFKV